MVVEMSKTFPSTTKKVKSGERGLQQFPSAPMIRAKHQPHPQLQQWLRVLMGTFLICISLAMGSLAGVLSQTIQISGEGTERKIRIFNSQTGTYEDVFVKQQALNPLDMFSFSSLDRKVNILLLGSDYNYVRGKRVDDKQAGIRSRTDTIMLASLDPATHKVSILSLPRDTRTMLPGYHIDKINAAMTYGGVDLVKATVSELTGVPIDYYMALKVDGLINTVDILGGIRLYVEKDMRYQDDTAHLGINIHKGWKEHMNGEQAHQYVRFRKDELGDIGRVQRQQKFIKAVMDKLLQPQSLTKVPQLLQHLNENIETDIPSDVIGQMIRFGAGLQKDDLRMVMLPGTFANIGGISYWQMDSYLAPNVIGELFPDSSLAPTPDPYQSDTTATGEPVNPYARYRVSVWNASGDIQVGREVVRRLREAGWNVVSVVKAPHGAPSTRFIAQTGKSELLTHLQSAVRFPRGEALTASIGDISSDFTVLICEDLAIFLRNTMTQEDWLKADRTPISSGYGYRRHTTRVHPVATQTTTSLQPAHAIEQRTPVQSELEPAGSPALQQTQAQTAPQTPTRQSSQNQPVQSQPAQSQPEVPQTTSVKPELKLLHQSKPDPEVQKDPLYDGQ